MDIGTIVTILTLLSGVALFLYGMNVMGEGLKQVAGSKLELILYKLTNTPLKGLLLGAGVTAIIQSSPATSVMVVGFVNSGLMKLSQAIGIIMGANIGTSITGWIICLSYIDGQQGLAQLLSTASLTAVVAIVGIIFRMFVKKESLRSVGSIMLGFAVLMVGMQTMSGAVAPLKENPAFIQILTSFSNPLLGILFGIALTAVLQSASAAVGVLQALSVTGAITFASCYPMIMGIGVGAACPVLLSAIGTNTNAKRTALTYLLNDTFALILGTVVFYTLNAFMHWPINSIVMDPFSTAAMNSIYRAVAMLALLPFVKWMEWFVCKLIPEKKDEDDEPDAFDLLEDRFLKYPALAISQAGKAMDAMSVSVIKNLNRAFKLEGHYSDKAYNKISEKERKIDKYEDKINTYLMQITHHELNQEQGATVSKFLHCIPDFERIGDHALSIAKVYKSLAEKKTAFSEEAAGELKVLEMAIIDIADLTVEAFQKGDVNEAEKVEPLKTCIRLLCERMKRHHTERLKNGTCSLEQALAFNELINDMERIADHCSNIAVYMIETDNLDLHTHKFVQQYRNKRKEQFEQRLNTYMDKYAL